MSSMKEKKTIVVTGGAGFIGSQFVRTALMKNYRVLILDALTYAGSLLNVQDVLKRNRNCEFFKIDLSKINSLGAIFENFKKKYPISGIVHFAAETHVDNSIFGPKKFIHSNIVGTFNLLEVSRHYWSQLNEREQRHFKFVHISTDEVFGELGEKGQFNENSPYNPRSPYSATKAGSDFLAKSWHNTYQFPVVVTNCSNNYGPRQYPEKLIPVAIQHALNNLPIPVYGKGENIRDWIHVEDHCNGVLMAFEKGKIGETYLFGGHNELKNIDVISKICQILDELSPKKSGNSYKSQIEFVKDRPGHDFRYSIDDTKAIKELSFTRKYHSFDEGLRQTIHWYIDNKQWMNSIMRKKK